VLSLTAHCSTSSTCFPPSGISLGVALPAGRWLEMTGLILVALLPFGARDPAWTPTDHRLDRAGHRGPGLTARLAQRHLLPARLARLRPRHRPVPSLLLARAGKPRGARRRSRQFFVVRYMGGGSPPGAQARRPPDILHSIEHALAIEDAGEEPDRWLLIGSDRVGNLLEGRPHHCRRQTGS
jgi:hypothetical protein